MNETIIKKDNGMAALFLAFLQEHGADAPELIEMDRANPFADALLIAGANSRRQAQGLADGIMRLCHENKHEFLGMEGYDLGDWILIDCNDVIVNIFQKDTRDLYKLEDLWARSARKTIKENV